MNFTSKDKNTQLTIYNCLKKQSRLSSVKNTVKHVKTNLLLTVLEINKDDNILQEYKVCVRSSSFISRYLLKLCNKITEIKTKSINFNT